MAHEMLRDTRLDTLPWRDAHLLLSEHGAGAGDRALQRVSDFEERHEYGAAVWWGRVYVAISHLTGADRFAGAAIH